MTLADWIKEQREIEGGVSSVSWTVHAKADGTDQTIVRSYDGGEIVAQTFGHTIRLAENNADFIANARTALPKALRIIEFLIQQHKESSDCVRCVCEEEESCSTLNVLDAWAGE